jgi:hypothetical protein
MRPWTTNSRGKRLTMNGSSTLMGNTGINGSIIVGCGSNRRGWGATMGIGDIVDRGSRRLEDEVSAN